MMNETGTPTLASINATLDRITKRQEETAKRQEETAKWKKQHDEEYAKWKEESDKRQAQRDEEYAKWKEQHDKEKEEEFIRWKKEFDQGMKELRAVHAETEAVVKRTSKIVGQFTNSWGRTIEVLLTPSLASKFKKRGYAFEKFSREVEIKNHLTNERIAEIDVFVENGEYALVVEVKTKPCIADIADHIQRMEKIHTYALGKNDRRKFIGAIAAPAFFDKVKTAVIAAGLFVIEASEEAVKIDVPKDFQPKEW